MSENQNGRIIKRKNRGFTQISNDVLRNEKISLKAKGLYCLIESYLTLEDWILYKNFIMSKCKEGQKAFDSAWKELKDADYLIQYKLKSEKGVWYYEYELLDEPLKPSDKANEEPHPQNGSVDSPHPQNVGVENGGVDKVDVEKGGLYEYLETNTDSTNTNRTEQDSIDKYNNIINKAKETELTSSELSKDEEIKSIPAIIPTEYLDSFDKWFMLRFNKERQFYNLDFNEGNLYNIFSDAVIKTQLQDNVEVLTVEQYAYFTETLHRMLSVKR